MTGMSARSMSSDDSESGPEPSSSPPSESASSISSAETSDYEQPTKRRRTRIRKAKGQGRKAPKRRKLKKTGSKRAHKSPKKERVKRRALPRVGGKTIHMVRPFLHPSLVAEQQTVVWRAGGEQMTSGYITFRFQSRPSRKCGIDESQPKYKFSAGGHKQEVKNSRHPAQHCSSRSWKPAKTTIFEPGG